MGKRKTTDEFIADAINTIIPKWCMLKINLR